MPTSCAEVEIGLGKLDGNLMVSQQFAQCLCAFRECSQELQQIILDMAAIVNDAKATDEERQAAVATIAEALFPTGFQDGLNAPGVDLEDSERLEPANGKVLAETMDREEEVFATRLEALMNERNLTQSELAEKIGVGQPAISMMLARKCRPQRRTIHKIAAALGVPPDSLWRS